MALVLGIDVGTSSTKALLLSLDGRTVGYGSATYPIEEPRPGWAEQSPEAWWRAVGDSVQEACHAGRADAGTVAAIGISGQMHGTVFLDREGRVVAPAVIWPDTRSGEQVEEITSDVGGARLVERTGSLLATGFQAATVRWTQQNRPEIWDRTRMILTPKDYVRYRLTGGLWTDPSDASGTLFLDIRERDWCDDILEMVSVDRARLPQIRESTAVAGTLMPQCAPAMGLSEGTPVVIGAADTAASALGAGALSGEHLLVTLGTGGQVVLSVGHPQTDPDGRIHTFCGALPPGARSPGWYQMGAILSAGMALQWLRDRVFALRDTGSYDQMLAWAEEQPVGAGGLLFVPYLTGVRTPHMDSQAAGVFLGLRIEHGRPSLVRAVVEGVALACYEAYQVLVSLGAHPQTAILAGRGGQSPLWCQIIADVFGLPVRHLMGSDQSAVGAAILAGSGVGLIDRATAGATWPRYGPTIEPSASRHAAYQHLFAVYQETYRKHKDDFGSLRAADDGSSRSPLKCRSQATDSTCR